MRPRLGSVGWLVLLGSALASCHPTASRREVGRASHTEPATGLNCIDALVQAGAVEFVPCEGEDVRIEVVVLLADDRPAADSRSEFAAHVSVEREAGRLLLRDAHAGAADANDWELRVTVRLPAATDLTARLSTGRLRVAVREANDVRLDLGSGTADVAVQRLAGACRIEARTAQVTLGVADVGPGGGLDVEVDVGAAHVTLPEAVRGSFTLDVATGGIDAADRYGLNLERRMAAVSARGALGEGGPRHSIRVGTGQIELR